MIHLRTTWVDCMLKLMCLIHNLLFQLFIVRHTNSTLENQYAILAHLKIRLGIQATHDVNQFRVLPLQLYNLLWQLRLNS